MIQHTIHEDTSEQKHAIRAAALRLNGFSKPILAAYLGGCASSSPGSMLASMFELLARGGDSVVFPPTPTNEQAYLVHGPRHFIVRGEGDRADSFTEREERFSFFVKAGLASPATLQCEGLVKSRATDTPHESRPVTLARGADYAYTVGGQWAVLTASTWEQARLVTRELDVLIEAVPFWNLVLDASGLPLAEHLRCQIGTEHASRLLGRAPVTLKRHLDRGLPASGHSRQHPGFTRAALEEFLAYSDRFPQGLSSPIQVGRWQRWQESWRIAYQLRVAESLGHDHRAQIVNETC